MTKQPVITFSIGFHSNACIVRDEFDYHLKIIKKAAINAGIKKRVHMLRHSFATHLLEQGTNIRIIQELLGHESIQTTEIYTYIANNNLQDVINPIDYLFEDTG